jgi:hypothetical protein
MNKEYSLPSLLLGDHMISGNKGKEIAIAKYQAGLYKPILTENGNDLEILILL